MSDSDLNKMTPEVIQQMFDALKAENETLRYAFEERRDQVAFLSIITENMSDIVSSIDKEGKIIFTGKSIEILGYDPDFMSGKNIMDFVHSEDVPQVMDAHSRLIGSNYARRIEYRCRCKDGDYLWIETRGTYFIDENNDEPRILLISRDITERKQAEQQTEIRLRLISYASGHSLLELMTKALDEIEQILDSSISFLLFVEPDQKNITLQQWSTATLERFCKTTGRGLHYSIDKAGVWADCIRERKGLIHNDYKSLLNKKGLPEGHAEVVREMVVPVMRRDVIVAIMGVGNKPSDYTQEDFDTLAFLADVTWEVIANKQMEEALITSEERLRGITDSTKDAIIMMDPLGTISFWNPAAERILGYQPKEVIGKDLHELLAPKRYHKAFRAAFPAFKETGRGQAVGKTKELSVLHKDGREVMVDLTLSAVFLQGKWHSAGVLRDITERKKMEEELIRLAATDNLTGLLNRRVFMEKLAEEISRCHRYGKAAVVMMLDLDHFKAINDTYGHATGDSVLRDFARLLIENIRETDVAGRLGGEEFAVLLPETTMDTAMAMAQRILNHIRKSTVSTEAGDVRFTVSIGFAQLDANDTHTDQLLARSDAALYRAKGKGRDRAEAEFGDNQRVDILQT